LTKSTSIEVVRIKVVHATSEGARSKHNTEKLNKAK
jgi:hypothetical protein